MNIRFPRSIRSCLLASAFVVCAASAQAQLGGVQKPIEVAAGLQSKKGVTDPQPNTVAFDCPDGDGRRGAKGILLKASPGNGSTWHFKFIRNHEGEGSVQLIHPAGRGHFLVTIRAKEIRVATPKVWAEAGWGGGETKPVNEKPAFKKIFPLKDDQEYDVVTRVTPGGAFSVFFDGEMVVSGHLSGASPLTLTNPAAGKLPSGFRGPDLPMVWSPGWAGLIVGPVDGSRNEVKNIQFTPAIIDVPASQIR